MKTKIAPTGCSLELARQRAAAAAEAMRAGMAAMPPAARSTWLDQGGDVQLLAKAEEEEECWFDEAIRFGSLGPLPSFAQTTASPPRQEWPTGQAAADFYARFNARPTKGG